MTDLPDLSPSHFAPWFEQLWGYDPFPWQQELVDRVHAERRWPALIDLPTGTGKTSLIDIAVFLMALDAENDPGERWMPRRVVTVVDRRVVVDQAGDRAQHIAETLTRPDAGGEVARVAARLRRLAELDDEQVDDPPLLVAALRGALAKDESWMRRPDVPAVISSTVDQAGSRLLFRGYGISRAMRPIHAGLLGNDVLWLLDEVHLARPFAQTLAQVRQLRAWRTGGAEVPDRWGVVEMSATPAADGPGWPRLQVEAARRIDDGPTFPAEPLDAATHPVIGRRLRASKPATLREVKVTGDREKADSAFAAACVEEVRRLVNGGTRTVGVVVNRVDTARRAWRLLHEGGTEAVLLTGRMRPIDRDDAMRRYRSRLETGRHRSAVEQPLVVVATQCIEAGADLDLDALVTEVASLDALRQRFGRADRDGALSEAGQQATSAILARSTSLREPDPIYGEALRRTWRWLADLPEVDFGIRRLQPPPPRPEQDADPDVTYLEDLLAPARRAPMLLPTHLDQLCQTSAPVSADVDISRWLHGTGQDASTDVQVVWRADIDEELIRDAADDVEPDGTSAVLGERLGPCPPASLEALSVPLRGAREWLARGSAPPVADVEGAAVEDNGRAAAGPGRPWVRWRAGQAIPVVDREPGKELRPGDVVVVPAAYGGLESGTWSPDATEPVVDRATAALHRQGRLEVVRLFPGLVEDAIEALPTRGELEALDRREQQTWIEDLLDELVAAATDGDVRAAAHALRREARRVRHVSWPKGAPWGEDGRRESVIVAAPAPPRKETSILTGAEADTEPTDEASSFTGAPTGSLQEHLRHVGRFASQMAARLGLGAAMVDALERAGALHDEGKRDPRFQLLLHAGDELALASAPHHLAKSRRAEPSAKRRRELRRRSRYPRGARHELTSLAVAPERIEAAHDPELVAHLVASHHGWCRPFAPPVIDEDGTEVPVDEAGTATVPAAHGLHRLDAPPPARFWVLNQRYGWFHLAWLEAILRLADHRRSEWEQLDLDARETAKGAA